MNAPSANVSLVIGLCLLGSLLALGWVFTQ